MNCFVVVVIGAILLLGIGENAHAFVVPTMPLMHPKSRSFRADERSGLAFDLTKQAPPIHPPTTRLQSATDDVLGSISDDTLAMEAFEWCSNLGAPAALVAGAVLATLSQTREDLAPGMKDPRWVRLAKKACRALLLSSFAMEIVCIFVTTVTGTMLLSHGDSPAGLHAGIHYHSAMGFLNHNHEFEYLTSRVTFLQGLLHWLAAVALDVVIPKKREGAAARKMNQFISSSLVALILMILSFYNGHMTFYSNYSQMLWRYVLVTTRRYFWRWPPRPMSFVSGPAWMVSFVLGWRAFHSPPDDDTNEG